MARCLVFRTALVAVVFGLTNPDALWAQQPYADAIMAGISNHGHNQGQPYITAGDRMYLIGTQDGNFPDMGTHVPGEMGGLWLHPIKLVDGFWAKLSDATTGREVALRQSAEHITYPYGSRFRYGPVLDGLEVERFEFSPDGQDGLVVQYTVRNPGDLIRRLEFELSVKTDLSPVWFSERLGIKDARDSVAWQADHGLFLARDIGNTWFAAWGATPPADARPISKPPAISTKGPGATAASRHTLSVGPRSAARLTFVFAGSASSPKAAIASFRHLAKSHSALLAKKRTHYASVIQRARVTIPDSALQTVYNWVKINSEWLVRDVPGIGRGLGAGVMEYPWWFGTETYSLQALMATGDFDLPKQTLRLLLRQSQKTNGNGRIVHEVTTTGAVSNAGNTQETAQFILTAGRLVDWSGDLDFAREMYPAMKQGLDWLLSDMDRNRNLFPEGYGIMEVSGLNAELIDVAVYTEQALRATARIATILKEPAAAARYSRLASDLQSRINDRFWVEEEGSYADFFGSRAQAIQATEGAIRQIGLKGDSNLTALDREQVRYYRRLGQEFSARPEESRGWSTNKNWVITTPLETGIAPRAGALSLLDKIRRENVGAHGPFLSAVEQQAMMTISTGVQAVSEANYGRTEQALWYMDRIVGTFNLRTPGSISEMMPDYGCFAIAWTSYGIVLPLVQHVFGVQPDAVNRTVVFDPHFPAGWENMAIEDLPIGTNTISFSRLRTGSGIEYRVRAREDGWTFVLRGNALSGARHYLNGSAIAVTDSAVRMTGRKSHVLVVR